MESRLTASAARHLASPTSTSTQFGRTVSSLALLLIAILVIPALEAQKQPEPAEAAAAPVPAQIVAAKRVFIGNNASDHDVRLTKYIGGSDGIYNQFMPT